MKPKAPARGVPKIPSAGQVKRPATGLSEFDRGYVTYLARDIQSVSEVLDDLVYSQLEYGHPGDQKWEALLHALTDFIGEASTRLVKELTKTAPRKAVA